MNKIFVIFIVLFFFYNGYNGASYGEDRDVKGMITDKKIQDDHRYNIQGHLCANILDYQMFIC